MRIVFNGRVNFLSLIEAKRDGQALTVAQLQEVVAAVVAAGPVAAAVDGAVVAAGEHALMIRTTTAAKTAIVDGFFPIDSSSENLLACTSMVATGKPALVRPLGVLSAPPIVLLLSFGSLLFGCMRVHGSAAR